MRRCLRDVCPVLWLLVALTVPAFPLQEDLLVEQIVILNEINESMVRQDAKERQEVSYLYPLLSVYWRLWLVRGEKAWYALRHPDNTVWVLRRDGVRWTGYAWRDGKLLDGVMYEFDTRFSKNKEGLQQSRQLWMRLMPDPEIIKQALSGFQIVDEPQELGEVFNLVFSPSGLPSRYCLRSFPVVDSDGDPVGSYYEWYLKGLKGWQAIVCRQAYIQGRLVCQEYTIKQRTSRSGDEKLFPFLGIDHKVRTFRWTADLLETVLRSNYRLVLSEHKH